MGPNFESIAGSTLANLKPGLAVMDQSTRNHTPVAVMPASDDCKDLWIIIIGLLLDYYWIIIGLSTVPAVRAAIVNMFELNVCWMLARNAPCE